MFREAESDPILPKGELSRLEPRLRATLLKAQYDQLAREDHALLIVVAGIDGAGKGDTVNLLNEWMDPRHIHTLAFDQPTEEEAERPELWRYWKRLPPKGRTGIVFGSWYQPLLREAARKHPNAEAVEAHAERVRQFEAVLSANKVHIVKLWYHLSAKAQADRAQRRLSRRETAWQVTHADLKVEKKFDRLRAAGTAALTLTHTAHAPWAIIPSADDSLRTLRTVETVLAALHRKKPVAPASVRLSQPDTRIKPIIPNRLGEIDYDIHADTDSYETKLGLLQGRFAEASRSGKFRKRHALVLAFEGQDAAGKGGAIRRVTKALDARQYDITPIAAPASYEQARPYLWRFWRDVPGKGRIAIFDRTWYGRVLVERVEKLTPQADWRRAYDEINDFEQQLADNNIIILKFWLAVTPDVQLQRFKEREKSAFKNFKITPEDWRNRDKWDAYVAAANEMFARTDTRHAPWHVIPANDKRHTRLQVLHHIVEAVEAIT